MEEYGEEFQYIDRAHTDKDEARAHKAQAAGYGRTKDSPAFRTARFTFDSLFLAHDGGVTFRRLPTAISTRMVFLDIDRKDYAPYASPVTMEELESALRTILPVHAVTRSASGSEGSWHILGLLDSPVDMDAYGYVVRDLGNSLRIEVEASRGISLPVLCDPAMESPQQTMFGPPRAECGQVNVPGSSPPHLERTGGHPEPRPVDTAVYRHVPLNPGEFIRYLESIGHLREQRVTLEYSFSAWLPYKRAGSTKESERIPEGRRDSTLFTFVANLADCFRAWNLYLGEHGLERFSLEELAGTFTAQVSGCFDDSPGFDMARLRTRLLARAGDTRLSDREACRMSAAYAMRSGKTGELRHDFRTRVYCKEKVSSLVSDHMSPGGCLFDSRESMLAELSSAGISESCLRGFLRKAGATLVYSRRVQGGTKKPRGPSRSLDGVLAEVSGEIRGDTVYYAGEMEPKNKMFLKRNGFKLKKSNNKK